MRLREQCAEDRVLVMKLTLVVVRDHRLSRIFAADGASDEKSGDFCIEFEKSLATCKTSTSSFFESKIT